ncbi:MAG TPA: hypothetical protein VK961_17095 [Chthoniobacter sp.]|nr:hypothetical protein [Chthoniobacter sp.]
MMRAATYRLNELAREGEPREPQTVAGALPHMLQGQPPLMRADKVAAVTGWSRRKIYELCEAGLGVNEPALLEAHALPGRSVQRKQITRRSVAALLLRTANYDERDFPKLLQLTLPTMALPQLREFATALGTEIQEREQAAGAADDSTQHQTKTTKSTYL